MEGHNYYYMHGFRQIKSGGTHRKQKKMPGNWRSRMRGRLPFAGRLRFVRPSLPEDGGQGHKGQGTENKSRKGLFLYCIFIRNTLGYWLLRISANNKKKQNPNTPVIIYIAKSGALVERSNKFSKVLWIVINKMVWWH